MRRRLSKLCKGELKVTTKHLHSDGTYYLDEDIAQLLGISIRRLHLSRAVADPSHEAGSSPVASAVDGRLHIAVVKSRKLQISADVLSLDVYYLIRVDHRSQLDTDTSADQHKPLLTISRPD